MLITLTRDEVEPLNAFGSMCRLFTSWMNSSASLTDRNSALSSTSLTCVMFSRCGPVRQNKQTQ